MKLYAPPIAFQNLKSSYPRLFTKRSTAKTMLIKKLDEDKNLIAGLKTELTSLSFKYRSVFDNSNCVYIITDENFNIIDFNTAALKMAKKLSGKKMLAGDKFLNLFLPPLFQLFTDNLNRSLMGEKSIIERKIRYKNNRSGWWWFEFSPTFDDNGAISGIIFSGIEITKRKIYEEKIREQHNKLMEISALQSHEIRGPVSTILGLMSLIKADNYQPNRDYLLLLELTTEQLDKNIRKIVALAGSDTDLQLFEKIDRN